MCLKQIYTTYIAVFREIWEIIILQFLYAYKSKAVLDKELSTFTA